MRESCAPEASAVSFQTGGQDERAWKYSHPFLRLDTSLGHHQVNHDEEFSTAEEGGINQNQAESFHLRVRRMVMGQTHKAGPHFEMYASEMAFREDTRRMPKAEIVGLMLKCLLTAPLSRGFTKYGRLPAGAGENDPVGMDGQVFGVGGSGAGNVIPLRKAA